ncbi:hypothetical protein GTO27_03975 [Candidatus Bathyarchaeota archaeon]|nr:hypothetical protein [Candidatus Bathyarchaeota archaeon]
MKLPQGNSKRLRFLIKIFGVIIAIAVIPTPILPITSGEVFGVLFLVWFGGLLGLGLLVWMFLRFGWEHDKWYIQLYTSLCFGWEIFCALALLWTFGSEVLYGLGNAWSLFGSREPFIVTLQTFVLAFPSLVPIWYWCYKEHREEEELRARVITREEYEQKRKEFLEQ